MALGNFNDSSEKKIESEKTERNQEKSEVKSYIDERKQDLNPKYQGGSYKDMRNNVERYELKDKEVHHMPADSVSKLERSEGPAIIMDKEDHRLTASYGNSREAQEYRAAQKELIDKGDFKSAYQMDVDDLHSKFGDKYDAQIEANSKYVDELEKEGKTKYVDEPEKEGKI